MKLGTILIAFLTTIKADSLDVFKQSRINILDGFKIIFEASVKRVEVQDC